MGRVAVGLTMSLDGFIAGPNDGPERPLGEGGERLFEWYSGGDTEYELPGTGMVFRISSESVELLREVNERMGAFVTGAGHSISPTGGAAIPRWVSRPLSSLTRCRRSGSTKVLPTPLLRTASRGPSSWRRRPRGTWTSPWARGAARRRGAR